MNRLSKLAWIVLLSFLAIGTSLTPASAQSDQATISKEGNVPGGTLGNQSDANIWRQIRQGVTGTVAGEGPERGLLIQAQGTNWEQTRTGTIGKYVAWGVVATLALLPLFFALRGRIRIDAGLSGKKILRFTLIERTGHWLLASSFIILALTGLNLLYGRAVLIPLFGKEIFSDLAWAGKYIHNFVGFAFIVALIWVAAVWTLHNFPTREDVKWLLSGGGIFGRGHPSAHKFNGGQKILFWLIILCGISISLSGWALLYPFTTHMFSGTFSVVNAILGTELPANLAAVQEQQYASLWHVILAGVMIIVVLAHIYIGSVGMEGAISAMTSGEVDVNWAKQHHDLWVEEQEAKAIGKEPSSHPAE